MKDPVKKLSSKTRRRANRSKSPFIEANRKDLFEYRKRGCPCGYKGKALVFVSTEAAPRSPATLTTVSRIGFLRALAGCSLMCYNCAVEGRDAPGRPRKRVCIRGQESSALREALSAIAVPKTTAL